ncbi:MAG: MBL fold metallo-hydrolase [Candidatus Woesearchaeota archaeon]
MYISNVEINWLGHAGFRITDTLENRKIYIDPYQIDDEGPADILLITHSHYDHCSIADIKKIATPKTVILAPPDCQSKLQGKVEFRDLVLMNPGKNVVMGNINVEAVHAYNIDKEFHPKENEWVGYIVDVNSKRIYHSGDTDAIPEMLDIHKPDVALMAVSGTYVMTPEEAAKAVESCKARMAIPMHYGAIIGDKTDAEKFKRLAKVPVEILEKD